MKMKTTLYLVPDIVETILTLRLMEYLILVSTLYIFNNIQNIIKKMRNNSTLLNTEII